jgi:hypothetical protein
MGSPIGSLTTLRSDLGGSVEAFDLAADRIGFIALKVLPVFESKIAAGNFGKIPIEELLKNPEVTRNNRGGYNRTNVRFTQDSFATSEYGLESPVDERDAKLYADYFDAEVVAAEAALDGVLRAQEMRAAAAVFNAGAFTPNDVTNEWDDYDAATPLDDVMEESLAFYAATGLWPNALVMNLKVFKNLRNCEQVLDRINSAGAGDRTMPRDVTAAKLAELFDVGEVIVAGGSKNANHEGQTAGISQIWSDEYVGLVRVARTNNIKEPCLGRTIHWGADGSQIGGTFESYEDPQIRGDVVRCRHDVQEKLIHTPMCRLLGNITTTA